MEGGLREPEGIREREREQESSRKEGVERKGGDEGGIILFGGGIGVRGGKLLSELGRGRPLQPQVSSG